MQVTALCGSAHTLTCGDVMHHGATGTSACERDCCLVITDLIMLCLISLHALFCLSTGTSNAFWESKIDAVREINQCVARWRCLAERKFNQASPVATRRRVVIRVTRGQDPGPGDAHRSTQPPRVTRASGQGRPGSPGCVRPYLLPVRAGRLSQGTPP